MSDSFPEYLPLPWVRWITDGFRCWEHDCWEHHAKFDDNTPPVLYGYDASVIKERSHAIRDQSINNPTTAQQFLQYEIVTEFLHADCENASIDQYYSIFESWAVLLDRYFFGGHLTQGPEKLINLRVCWFSYGPLYAFTSCSMGSPASRIVMFLRHDISGVRYSKALLFETLLHEMCHCYLNLFYNVCPVKGDAEVELEQNKGHAVSWSTLFWNACEVVARWHPEFSSFDKYPKLALQAPAAPRLGIKDNFISILQQAVIDNYYRTAHHRWPDQGNDIGSLELHSAIFDIHHGSLDRFLLSRFPFLMSIVKAVLVLNVVIFCFFLFFFWTCGYLGEFLALLCYGFMVSNNEVFICEIWFTIFGSLQVDFVCLPIYLGLY